jgi:translocation and assembly module TamB
VTDPASTPARKSRWKLYLLLAAAFVLLLVGAGLWYTTTESFQLYVRSHIVSALERATGARVELGAYHTIPLRLQVEIRDLTLHGLESSDQVPLAHIDSAVARIKVISLLQKQFGFESVVLEHPVVHLIVYPDGSTNQPVPKVPRTSTKSPVAQIFDLNINDFSVRSGEFLWNDQKIPFDFNANNLSADLTYSYFRRRYSGHVVLGHVASSFRNYAPFAWTAAAQFSFGQRASEIQSLTWSSGRSRFTFKGAVRNYSNPTIEGNYTASFDLAEAAGILRVLELRKGALNLEGVGSWSSARFGASGKFDLRDLEYHDPQLSFRDAALASDFSLDNRALKLMHTQGRAFGGSLSGDAEVENWMAALSPPPRGVQPKKGEETRGLIRVRVKDMLVDSVASAFARRSLPLDRVNLDGAAEGTLETRWKGSLHNLETDFALNMAPPARRRPDHLPVSAHARGTYRALNDELELSQFDLSTRNTQLRASGKMAERSTLQISASTTDLPELQPLIVALGGPSHLPVSVQGNASFNGTASGKFSAPVLVGRLQVDDFTTEVPATSRTPRQSIHWDSLAGDVQLSPSGAALRRVSLSHDATLIHGDASANLSRWSFLADDPFTAQLNVQQADVAEWLKVAGYPYPVSGLANLHVQAGGTRAQPHADGHLHLSELVVSGEPIAQLDTDLHWAGEEGSLNNLQLVYYDAKATGGASFNPSTRAFRFNLSASNFDLQHIRPLECSRVLVEGRADVSAQGAGTIDQPEVTANIRLRDLAFDHERSGDLNIDVVTQGRDAHITAHSNFERARFDLTGTVGLHDDYPADLTLDFDHFDVDAFLHAYLRGRITGHSSVVGRIQARGPLRDPRQLAATAELSGLSTDISNVKIHNEGPVRFTVAQDVLRIEQLHLVGDGTDFTAHGTAALTGDRQLDLASRGRVDLNLLQTLNSDFYSSGNVDITLDVTGPMKDPQLQGRVNVVHGALSYAGVPSGLSDMNGSLVFNKNRLQVESLTAHSGGGTLTLTGQATAYAGKLNFDFNAVGQDIRLRYPPGVSSTASAQIRFYGTPDSSTVSGDITVNKLAITPGFDFSSYAAASQSVIVPPATSPLYGVKLDVHVTTAPDLQMQTALARLSGAADLRIRGTAAKPALLGRIDVLEGEVSFNGVKFHLERGEVLFTSPVSIEPILDLQASTRVRDYDITVSINGSPSKLLAVKYRSDPPLPEADIIGLLAVGQTREESALLSQSGQSGFTQTASGMILSEAINATVSNRVQRLFGISKIKIDPQGLSTETNPTRGPQVTIEQQISNKFTLTYSQNVSQASQQIIQGEYYIRRNVSIVGTRDQNGVVSMDIKIRQRKK